MKNNKGMTLVEVVVSIVLLSIIVLFLFRLLLMLKTNNQNDITYSKFITTRDLFLNNVYNDINALGVKNVYFLSNKCDTNAANAKCCCKMLNSCTKIIYNDDSTGEIVFTTSSFYYNGIPYTFPNEISYEKISSGGSIVLYSYGSYDGQYKYDYLKEVRLRLIVGNSTETLKIIFPLKKSIMDTNVCS